MAPGASSAALRTPLSKAVLAPPFRAEQIGSFIRPPELLASRDAYEAGQLSAGELREAENEAIRQFVTLQERLGFRVVTDGEFRRSTYTANFTTSGLTGVSAEQNGDGQWSYRNAEGHVERGRLPAVHDRIKWNDSQNAKDFAFLQSITHVTPKITLPGPCYIHFRAGRARISRDVYPDLADFWSDLVAAYETELNTLFDAGCRYVQFDETSLAKLGDPNVREALEARGDPWETLLDQYLAVIGAIARRAPNGMRIGLHLCRGNRMGHWQAAGGYETVAAKMFRDLPIDFFFLEYDCERAGGFEPLRLVPDHKAIVLGLISTKVSSLETEDFLVSRVHHCARHIDIERLAISPQCGFSSSDTANKIMTRERAAQKLERVAQVAHTIWGD